MSEKNIERLFKTIADILSEKTGVTVVVKSITKKEKAA